MADGKTAEETSDQEIAERTGFGTPPAPEGEAAPAESEEESETTEEADGEEPEATEDAPESETEEDTESDDDQTEDEPEEGDEAEDDDTEDEPDRPEEGTQRTVPYSKLKSERQKRKTLEAAITDLRKDIADMRAERTGKPAEEELSEIEKEAQALGSELNLDSKGLAKVLKSAVDLARKELGSGKLPTEVEDKLKLLDVVEEKAKAEKEATHFAKEWDAITPALKKQFPNASDAMLAEAKNVMDELAHSKQFHRYDLDYILYKNRKKFETILKAAPGTKSGETGKQVGTGQEVGEEGDEALANIEDLTPEMMKERERKEISRRSAPSSSDDYSDIQIIEPES